MPPMPLMWILPCSLMTCKPKPYTASSFLSTFFFSFLFFWADLKKQQKKTKKWLVAMQVNSNLKQILLIILEV